MREPAWLTGLTSRQTISASYDNTYFDYQARLWKFAPRNRSARVFDRRSRANGISARWLERVRVYTLGLTQVPLDPAIAALIGQNFAVVTFANVLYLPGCRSSFDSPIQSRVTDASTTRPASRRATASISRPGKLRAPLLTPILPPARCEARRNAGLQSSSRAIRDRLWANIPICTAGFKCCIS